MHKINSIYDLLNIAPLFLIQKFLQCKRLKERSDFHSEKNTAEHIKIVVEKLITTNDINLILAGLYHDICKFDAAILDINNDYKLAMEEFNDNKHFSINRFLLNMKTGKLKTHDHPTLAIKFINEKENIKFIEDLGGDVILIKWLVENHMKN